MVLQRKAWAYSNTVPQPQMGLSTKRGLHSLTNVHTLNCWRTITVSENVFAKYKTISFYKQKVTAVSVFEHIQTIIMQSS